MSSADSMLLFACWHLACTTQRIRNRARESLAVDDSCQTQVRLTQVGSIKERRWWSTDPRTML